MKHLITLSLLFFLCNNSYSQAPLITKINEAPAHHSQRNMRALNSSSSRHIIDKEKISFIDMYISYFSTSGPDFDYYYLFPDSAIKALYNGVEGAPFHHSFSQVFDMRSPIINQNSFSTAMLFDTLLPFTIDTIASYGVYEPSRNPTVVDTLIYRLIPSSTLNLRNLSTVGGTLFPLLETDSNTFVPPGIIAEYKVPLFLSDTLPTGLIYPTAYSGVIVPSLFAVTIDFKPGSSYTPFIDTMGYGVGSYTMQTVEFLGDGTDPNTTPGFYIPGDLNAAHLLTSQARYNNGGTWNGNYIPYFAFGASQFEAVDIELTVSQSNSISIEENFQDAQLFQNYPNPANGATTVGYSLQNEATVTFEMIDVTGKKVFSSFEGNKNSGTYSIELNTSEFNSGVYFYSLIVDGNRVTKKMIVSK